jgi:heavy metal sensor kinase
MIDGHPALIRVGFSEEPMWQRFWQLVIGLIVGLPLALGLAGVGGYFVARRALSPVERMARRAREINAERLGARIDVENPHDELGLLAEAFNETLCRLERSFEQLKRFTSDASHELRTPLTAIRSVGEVGLQQGGNRHHYREVIGSMLEETGRLSRLVESLLSISRADSGQIRLEQATIALLPLVREASSLLDVLAEEKGQTVSLDGDESIRVKTDVVILRQVVINLLDNAIKYSPRSGHISVLVLRNDSLTACVEIEDCGPGIPPEHRDKIFDRFYRIDEARSREAGGAGLGLAIAKWGAEAHGGRLVLTSTATGCIFHLLLPVSAESTGEGLAEDHSGANSRIFSTQKMAIGRN